ncbi:KTSC domain-containing protein [Mesorhizobium sp.]|uniref:KTSC domain-containing protein n=1 Tax=Mesorhizobium sp. TaxID=1871066 RepID=UPI00338EDAF6
MKPARGGKALGPAGSLPPHARDGTRIAGAGYCPGASSFGIECWEMPSTVIQSINYDPATRTLSVWFVPSGNRYDFNDVPPQTYAACRKAWSKGRFFNAFIRDRYSYHLVEQSPSG